jgi:hypothetical protein
VGEVDLEVNLKKSKYTLMSCSQKIGEKHNIKIANRSFEDVAKFGYLGTTLTDQNCMHEEIKSRLNSGNACYHSVQSLLSSHLLSKNLKVKTYKTIILPVVLYGCETWSITSGEELRLRVFENRVLRIFGPNRDEVMGQWKNFHNGQLHNSYSSPDIIGQDKINENEVGGACSTHGRWEKSVQGVGGRARREKAICKTKA